MRARITKVHSHRDYWYRLEARAENGDWFRICATETYLGARYRLWRYKRAKTIPEDVVIYEETF